MVLFVVGLLTGLMLGGAVGFIVGEYCGMPARDHSQGGGGAG